MDRITKNSLIFGGLVGGAVALAQNAAEKRRLTNGQVKDLEALKEAFNRLQDFAKFISFVETLEFIKEHEPEREYALIGEHLSTKLQELESGRAIIDAFRTRLNQVLSPRFTAERANDKTHEVQANFSQLTPVPERLETMLEKRVEMLKLLQTGYAYIASGEADDLESTDRKKFSALAAESKALEGRTMVILGNFKWE
ncbi:MAG: hypothetical protein KGI78_00390 [Patescibacteria group bacterium]|nr:hypothetical protein [Patescibacteria group bacterium]MDE1944851.1 hypothetical protein [Patescibacteria group bacterium]MDE2057297.1 hypothetical protein [Patescibacteria group bacterium]